MAGVVSCFAHRLTAGIRARRVSKWGPSGPYRLIDRIHRHVSYGNPELVVTFSDGSTVRSAPGDVWEVEE